MRVRRQAAVQWETGALSQLEIRIGSHAAPAMAVGFALAHARSPALAGHEEQNKFHSVFSPRFLFPASIIRIRSMGGGHRAIRWSYLYLGTRMSSGFGSNSQSRFSSCFGPNPLTPRCSG